MRCSSRSRLPRSRVATSTRGCGSPCSGHASSGMRASGNWDSGTRRKPLELAEQTQEPISLGLALNCKARLQADLGRTEEARHPRRRPCPGRMAHRTS